MADNVTNMAEFRERKGQMNDGSSDILTDLLTDPAKRKKAAGVLGLVAAGAAFAGFMAQGETRVLSTTGSEVQNHQIVSVTAQNQLGQAIAEAAGKAPEDKLKVLQNGGNLVTVQEAIVGADGKPFADPSAIDANTKQFEPVVEITNTTSRFDALFSPDRIGELGVQATPVSPIASQPR